ncbi:NAD+ synthase [Rhodoluna limnophila]|uniref:NAD+ synthase n=1 Tax=Rhodoluna limnophila TaxID=232537 RepID=UPI00110621EB|nr:NAD+ synthase [Rhodoluna limnophila]
MPIVRLAMAQTNPIVGDISGNLANCLATVREAAANQANLVVFGEMCVAGYPIEDLATSPDFIEAAESAVREFAIALEKDGFGDIAVVIGHPSRASASTWAIAHNSASVLLGGTVLGRYDKHHLPNYSVFDEYRVFVPGNQLFTFEHGGLKFSTLICEDIWQSGGPVAQISNHGTDIALVLNGSPFEVDKGDRRLELVKSLALTQDIAVAYVNLTGGQDDLVFDGDSLFVDSSGELVVRAEQFQTSIDYVDITSKSTAESKNMRAPAVTRSSLEEQVWNALVTGLKDYVAKNGFKSVILGLSGGIDSAVCASIAADAIGAENVFGVLMPSEHSSDHSIGDALDLAQRIGLNYQTESIKDFVDAFEKQIPLTGLAAENLQARARGLILMSLSNERGHLTLTTGNKTELAVGYSTIYGDSVGGFAPIKDVEKTLVWRLANWRNQHAVAMSHTPPIPQNSIEKPPSAELRPGQVDQDSLPDYETLDALLELYVEKSFGRKQIIDAGFEVETVDRVISLVDRSEWKRRQGAIGPKISPLAFGRDRRFPITNRWTHRKS